MSRQTKASNKQKPKWSFWIDRGGTFTDILARTPEGEIVSEKLLSVNKSQYQDAAIEGIRRSLKLAPTDPIPAESIDTVKMGTTVATNALLEQKGEPTLLLTSEGLQDCLEIGTQARKDIFALNIIKPEMLYTSSVAIKERLYANGEIKTPLDLKEARSVLEHHFKKGLRSVAILFMHSYQFPEHEQQVAKLARQIGYTQISQSHKVSPLIKYIPRGDTTMIDAYLTPLLHLYTNKVANELDLSRTNIKLYFMTSSGTLTERDKFDGKDAILSGPAGGIVGAAKTAEAAGIKKIICFDMGGTSTDVAHFAGQYELSFETEIAGKRLQSPMLHIHTVAAGGGSILGFTHGRMTAGPESAGAAPGPLAYRNNGPLTITDANLLTGRIHPEYFPKIFGPAHDQPLDYEKVKTAFENRAREISTSLESSSPLTPEECADGYLKIANENMAAAIKKISVERGIDLHDYTLQCYGGAGGQHAVGIAESLGISKIYIHAHSSLLSAYGMGLASEAARKRTMLNLNLTPLDDEPHLTNAISSIRKQAAVLSTEARKELDSQLEDDELNQTITCYLNYQNQETKIPVHLADPATMLQDFEENHLRQFGFLQQKTPVKITQLEVEIATTPEVPEEIPPTELPLGMTQEKQASDFPENTTHTNIYHNGAWHKSLLFHDDAAHTRKQPEKLTDLTLTGPALYVSSHQTVFVPDGWHLIRNTNGHINLIKKTAAQTLTATTEQQKHSLPNIEKPDHKPNPIKLELYNNLFMSIAEQMGEALRATAQSVNIKERLDFSCAIFDQHGALIANAPHMPVHLGSMDRAVEAIIKATQNSGQLKQGDAYMINAPYSGGTHLPDITVITPVFHQQQLIAFVASRGHHADIGGITPGSMSPNATTINEEGILIECFKLVGQNSFKEQEVFDLLTNHPFPARNPAQNIADLKAQLAANSKGIRELETIIANKGLDELQSYMGFVQDQAEQAVIEMIKRLNKDEASLFKGEFQCEMDPINQQSNHIKVKITPDAANGKLTIDFTGTSPQTRNNFNAPEPVTRAAVLYVLRTQIEDNIPMNAGCLRPVNIIIPENSMLAPSYPAAVVAGNVETSQVITNCLYGAFGNLGLSQGTMNNLTFGNEKVQYYETLCSGAPAGPGFHGAAAIHTHMTNSRLTDPEILETRYPVLLKSFGIDRGSGGKGKWNAGDGIHRTIEFLEPLTFALLTGYRNLPIPGINGGSNGRKGQNILEKPGKNRQILPNCCENSAEKGDCLTIITPTGGGYGPL